MLRIELKTAIREFEADFVAKYGHKVRTCTHHKEHRDKTGIVGHIVFCIGRVSYGGGANLMLVS